MTPTRAVRLMESMMRLDQGGSSQHLYIRAADRSVIVMMTPHCIYNSLLVPLNITEHPSNQLIIDDMLHVTNMIYIKTKNKLHVETVDYILHFIKTKNKTS